jgi:hypothetical protein
MVENTSRKPNLLGIHDYNLYSVIAAINKFTTPCDHPVTVEHTNIRKIKTYAGSQVIFINFHQACATTNIELSIATPNHQEKNHI